MSEQMSEQTSAPRHPFTTGPANRSGVAGILVATAAALALSSALTPAAQARGGGGGGGGGGGSHFGGGMHFGGSSGMSSFRSSPMTVQSLQASGIKTFKTSNNVVHHHDSVKTFKPKVTQQVSLRPKHVEKHFEPKHVVKHIVKPDVVKKNGPQVAQILRHKTNVASNSGEHIKKLKPVTTSALQTAHFSKGNNVAPQHNSMLKLKTQPVKLSQAQYLKAKIVDDKGHKYDAQKKMWFDGKHWWRGAWAWLFIDGVWYYGNRPWVEADSSWTTDGPDAPMCVDCSGGPSRIVSGPSKVTGRLALASTKDVTASATDSRPVTVDKVTFDKGDTAGKTGQDKIDAAPSDRKPKSRPVETASLGPAATTTCAQSGGAPTAKVEDLPGMSPDGEANSVTGSAETPAPSADCTRTTATDTAQTAPIPASSTLAMASGGQPSGTSGAEPVTGSASPVTECRQFVPAIGMTIEVPCSE